MVVDTFVVDVDAANVVVDVVVVDVVAVVAKAHESPFAVVAHAVDVGRSK